MIEIDWSMIALVGLYIVPAVISFVGNAIDFINDIKIDLKSRRDYLESTISYYHPRATIGDIFIAIIVSLFPLMNLVNSWNYVPDILRSFSKIVYKFFDFPIVSKKERVVEKK